ncbi:MAG: right-handed parallel beta-helix repeat-containing protein [Saprospiraceae bacterium]|nr:right-handed parallel beta-helix repeat-containing protein [Lewinella sp.]
MGAFDISRNSFDPRKHYASVRMQQGRVVTDDDWNENERIENEERRRSRVDIIGPYGSPDQGFRIVNPHIAGGFIDFQILPGSFHLGGLRLELTAMPAVLPSFRLQKDWLQQATDLHPAPALAPGEERFDLVFLEAWQQAVSAVEDEELLEKALGGPDTCTRIRTMRRVHVFEDTGFPDCPRSWQRLQESWANDRLGTLTDEHERFSDALLTVTYTPDGASDDLCSPSITGGYLGAENQAIRVQLTDHEHFTWGFDNAAPLYRVTASAVGDTITMLTKPKDHHHWPLAGQIIEIIPWSAVLPNGEKVAEVSGHLSKVAASFDPDSCELTLTTPLPAGFGEAWKNRSDNASLQNQTPAEYFYLRVWNRGTDLSSDPEIQFTPGNPEALGNTGLVVTIDGPARVKHDYWVIAARPETPDQVVPWRLETGMQPHGIRRFYAPLAVIRWYNTGSGVEGEPIRDCRKTFRPLTQLESCCTYHVGDGFHSHGDFNSIEEALQNLPSEGGKICVLPGEHVANVDILNRTQIRISGCGERSVIRPRPGALDQPIFRISSSSKIQLDNLSMVTTSGIAVQVLDGVNANEESRQITIRENWILACVNAIRIRVREDIGGNNDIYIGYNRIGMIDKVDGGVAIFSIADGVFIERNRIVVVPPPDPDNPDDPRDNDEPPGGFFDPCIDPQNYYLLDFPLQLYLKWIFTYVMNVFISNQRPITYRTEGGIQIGGSSERVRILENVIIGGAGDGIKLGHLPQVNAVPIDDNFAYYNKAKIVNRFPTDTVEAAVRNEFSNFIYEISIEGNHIDHMGLSGIGVVTYFSRQKVQLIISVEGADIHRNFITRCAHQIPDIPDDMVNEVGYGGIAFSDAEQIVISENRIEDNGNSQLEPVCGIFFLYGEKIDISNNRILNNGPQLADNDALERGLRGGIVVRNAFKEVRTRAVANTEIVAPDGVPAVKVHDNIVTQPAGQALYIKALGPVSVVGNQLTTQGADYRVNPASSLAGCVFIFNLGIAQELFWLILINSLKDLTKLNVADQAGRAPVNSLAAPTQAPDNNLVNRVLYWPSGEVLFSNNQVTLDLREEAVNIVFSSQLIISLDDVAYSGNQAQCISLVDILLTNAAILAFSIRANDNRFEDAQLFDLIRGDNSATLYSLISIGLMNTAIGNQATHCLLVLGNMVTPAQLLNSSNMVLIGRQCRERGLFLQSGLGIKEAPVTPVVG